MEYIKYALKSNEELEELLKDKDNLFVLSCNKCFKDFSFDADPDADAFVSFAKELGRNIVGTKSLDYVCNKTLLEEKIEGAIPENAENVIIISCGLGVQTMAGLTDKPVYTATDSLNYVGYHGMALTNKTCDACNQCYLNITGGICPIVDCTKSLVNGQCGGAKNGKCEIDPKKDCAWEKIYQKLKAQGRLEEFLSEPVQIRDYSKVNFKAVNEYVKSVREKRQAGYYGGIHPDEKKELSEQLAVKKFPDPETVVIPVSMHAGAPAEPVVKEGDRVKVGQIIAKASAFISSNVHSSVSGVVEAVEPRKHSNGSMCMSVVIKSDGKFEADESVKASKALEELTPDEIVEIVKDKGITGMGGAGFPTYVKLKPGKPIDTVLVNGCECEPIITADHRVLLEYADDIIYGTKAVMKAVDSPKGIIVIEDNKPDAIALLREKLEGIENVEVAEVKTKYPQGAEKMIIKRVLNRKVPSGGLPADVGAVVCNVSTVKAISDALKTGMPIVERVVTVSGERIKNPGNYLVRIGTNVNDLIEYCGGIQGEDFTVKMGGPMMGAVLEDYNVPVIKSTNGVIAVENMHTVPMNCIRCGRCVDVCPMELSPMRLARLAESGDVEGLTQEHVMDCMECGCCQYFCSSGNSLVQKIREGKKAVRGMKK